MPFLTIQGHSLEYEFAPTGRPVMVFLHEGLGSVSMWKGFPAQCAAACGCDALVYSRYGYGESDPLTEPRPLDYLHIEALNVLPQLLDSLEIRNPILFGHSDGASIALIFAGGANRPVRGVIALAPHVFIEEASGIGLAATTQAWVTTDLYIRLSRYHRDAESAFRGWSEAWMNPAFHSWNIEEFLPRIACPVLAIQGYGDEYGTMDQLTRIAAGAPHVTLLKLENCGHSPHRDQPEVVIDATVRFVNDLAADKETLTPL